MVLEDDVYVVLDIFFPWGRGREGGFFLTMFGKTFFAYSLFGKALLGEDGVWEDNIWEGLIWEHVVCEDHADVGSYRRTFWNLYEIILCGPCFHHHSRARLIETLQLISASRK